MAQVLSQNEVDALLNAVNGDGKNEQLMEFFTKLKPKKMKDDAFKKIATGWSYYTLSSATRVYKKEFTDKQLKFLEKLLKEKDKIMKEARVQAFKEKIMRSASSKLPRDYNEATGDDQEPNVQPYDLTNQAYDLTNQDRIIRGRMPILEIIYERFIRQFRVSLSNSLHKIATISIISTDLLKFGEFVNTLPIPSLMCIMRLETLRGPALIVFESKLAYALIDSYLGGTDRPFTKIEGKEFTTIELSIMRKVMDLAIKDLEDSWAPVHDVKPQYLRTEINPQFVGIVPPSDVVIATTLEVEFESASGVIMMVLPYSTIEPIKNKLGSSFKTDKDPDGADTLKDINPDLITDLKYKVALRVPEKEITIEELCKLKEGDMLPIEHNKEDPLSLTVNNKIIKGDK